LVNGRDGWSAHIRHCVIIKNATPRQLIHIYLNNESRYIIFTPIRFETMEHCFFEFEERPPTTTGVAILDEFLMQRSAHKSATCARPTSRIVHRNAQRQK